MIFSVYKKELEFFDKTGNNLMLEVRKIASNGHFNTMFGDMSYMYIEDV